jgi:hydroxymethylglutaryl-CoA reductase
MADKVVENVLGTYGMPFGVALNVRINGKDRLVPMVVEEPSVIAAASNAARMVREGGGFSAEVPESLMIGQIQLTAGSSSERAIERLEHQKAELLALAAGAVPGLVSRGGGPRDIEVRDLGHGVVVLHVLVDCCDAMGANLVNSIAESIGPVAARVANGTLGLRILSNLCDRRRVRATCRVHARDLAFGRGGAPSSRKATLRDSDRPPASVSEALEPHAIVDGIVAASRFAELDPYRAATHNKGIMNGVDAVVIATGNDFRAVEAGRTGQYRPLAVWRRDGEDLVGELEMPMALGTVGGTLRVHPVAKLALSILGTTDADELAMTAASLGLASGDEVEAVATAIAARGTIIVAEAELVLLELRAESPDPRREG